VIRGRYRPVARLRVFAVCAAVAALVAPRGAASLAAADPAPRGAPDDPVAAAAAAFAALRFDEALGLADQAWRRGDGGPDQLRRIFALAGRAAGSIGEDRAARLWFSRWLYLDPDAALPDGTSPKLTALLGDARAALGGSTLVAHASVRPGAIRVTVADDPLDLIAAARAGTTRVAFHDGAALVPVADAGEVRELELLDRYGNRLAAVGVHPAPADAPQPAAPPTPPPPARSASRAWYAHPVTWAVTTGVLAAAGGGALWIALDARNDINFIRQNSANEQYSTVAPELLSRYQRLDRAQLAEGIAFGAAGAAALVGTTLWLHDRREPAVAVSVAPGGARVAWRARF